MISRKISIAAGSLIVSIPAFAVLPQAGMWTFADEWNGVPGRGFQIENQGSKRTVFTYFDYRPDGTSRFMQAGGMLENGTTLSAPLLEFKGGGERESKAMATKPINLRTGEKYL